MCSEILILVNHYLSQSSRKPQSYVECVIQIYSSSAPKNTKYDTRRRKKIYKKIYHLIALHAAQLSQNDKDVSRKNTKNKLNNSSRLMSRCESVSDNKRTDKRQ